MFKRSKVDRELSRQQLTSKFWKYIILIQYIVLSKITSMCYLVIFVNFSKMLTENIIICTITIINYVFVFICEASVCYLFLEV